MSDLNKIKLQDISDGNTTTDVYENFRQKLMDVETFPSLYTFKFIVKNEDSKIQEVKAIFTHGSTKFSDKDSSGGKYKSITVETFVNTADEVIAYYKSVAQVESVMML